MGLNVYQTHCDLLQDPDFFCFAKASLQKRKNAKEETQTQNSNYHDIWCEQNSVQNSSNYHAPEWGLNPERLVQ